VIEHLLALRHSVEDSTLVDCLQLDQWLPKTPAQIRTAELRRRWHCSQATVSRRMTACGRQT